MRTAEHWIDYELLDCSDGERLERWGSQILIRPDPQIIWSTEGKSDLWRKANARYRRSSTGGGKWEVYADLPPDWTIGYGQNRFRIRTMGFKHTGIFPEQAVNWDMLDALIRNAGRPVKVLNLFAYTGGATISALRAGASVTHVDAAKGMVQWAKDNAALSGLSDRPVRWLVDDCKKLAEREIRRGNKYEVIVMDPPSYGRGPGGEVWKLEDEIHSFCKLCVSLLSDDPLMLLLNSYTTGLSPSVMQYLLSVTVRRKFGGIVESDEIGLPVTATGLVLPSGASAIWQIK